MEAGPRDQTSVSFSHVHFYVDSLKPLEQYKLLEARLNAFVESIAAKGEEVTANAWCRVGSRLGVSDTDTSTGQDLVEQLIVGLGWRIVGVHEGSTRSVLVASKDGRGQRDQWRMSTHVSHVRGNGSVVEIRLSCT